MILSFFLTLGAAAIANVAAAATTPLSDAKSGPAAPNVLPNTYILELENIKSLRRGVVTPHQTLYRRLEERGVPYQVLKEFSSDPFTGVSLVLNNDQDKKFVSSISGIKSFQPVRLWDPPTPVDQHVLTGPSDPRNPPDGESTHKMTGVDKLHALGILGKGILVGIIDTGIDYTHPALGNGFGHDHKVALGYDFVGDAYNGRNTPVPDSDPLDQCNGHGTHVAGIIAADPRNPYNISGVAFEAKLAAYRVFGCKGSVQEDILVDALLKAYEDGCDIITLSIGGGAGWTEAIAGVVASRIADAGRIVTIAAGNDGAEGAWYASGPATGLSVISVASVENSALSGQSIITSTGYGPILYNSLQPYPLPSPFKYDTYYSIYALSKDAGVANDGCGPLPDSTPDLSAKIVIVRRGGCPFTQKLQNIAAKGGNMSFIYDNIVEAPVSILVAPYNGLLISVTDGAYLVNQFAAGNTLRVKFPSAGGGLTVPDPSGGLINAFSSWGPSNDMYFKPAVAAPGGNIISTYPVPLGSYALLSGTSMATPFVAGSAALLLQKNGKFPHVARAARTLFETTALAIPQDKSQNSPLRSLAQAGAGLINAYNALTLRTTLSPGELLLNDTAHYRPLHRLTLSNNGQKQQSYSLEHHPAATANTIGSDGIQPLTTPVQTTDYASVQISPSQVTLHPGESAEIVVTITPPNTGNKGAFPVFSGFIQATGNLGENVHTSYLGLNAKTTDLVVIDNTNRYFKHIIPAILDKEGNVQPPGTSYSLKGDDVPTLVYRLASGSPAVYFDLVPINTTFTPTDKATRRRRRSSDVFERNWWLPGGYGRGSGGTFSKVPTIGPISVLKYQVRNTNDSFVNGGYSSFNFTTFANGTAFPKGGYKLLMRALKIAGDAKSESSYESWLSTPFGVL